MRTSSSSLGIVDPEMQAASLERVAHLAGIVRGQEDQRLGRRLDRADLGNRDLEVRQDLEQERLEFRIRLVDFVDQKQASASRM